MYRRQRAQAKTPESSLALAQFLGRHNRVTEALDLCEQAAKDKAPVENVATAGLRILYSAKASGEPCQRVARWIEAALPGSPRKVILLNYLAALHNLQGDYPQAEAVYRRVLEADGRDATALNNLAWLLAFQPQNNADALKLIERAVEIAGPLPTLLDTRAVIHLAAGRVPSAIKDLEEALAESPTASGYFHLAQAHLSTNRARAVVAFQQATERGLSEAGLHPLDRPGYRVLCARLDVQGK
jgi:tetratricopeptide (TPR) repeat protein